MPTHRSWSKKANQHLKQIFKVTTDQTRLDAIKEQCDRIAADYEAQYARATDPACQDKYNRECGAYHDHIVKTVGPARTCEPTPDLLVLEIAHQSSANPLFSTKISTKENYLTLSGQHAYELIQTTRRIP